MREWTVSIESPDETTRDADTLDLFLSALEADSNAGGPSASLDHEHGRLGTTFTVRTDDEISIDEVAFGGCLAYWGALASAGLHVAGQSAVTVAPADDESDEHKFNATPPRIERD